MLITQIQGNNFRNYNQFSLDFSSKINVFLGQNGQGKSSLLEAIYCALQACSFFPYIKDQFIQKNKTQSSLALKIKDNQNFLYITVDFLLSKNKLHKEIKYCGKIVSSLFLYEKFSCLSFTEDSMSCLRQGADQRRDFVDKMLSKDSKIIKTRFQRVLLQKKSLLKSMKKNQNTSQEASKTLNALNESFFKASVDLVYSRIQLLTQLFTSLKTIKLDFFKEEVPELDFEYVFSKDNNFNLQQWSVFFKQELETKKNLEIQAGTSLYGPHKQEIHFLFNKQNSRFFCSKGQQRLFLLALLGSHITNLSNVVLFLDDVLLELDEKHQKNFLQFLEKKHCPSFLTSCNLNTFKTKNTSFFNIEKGQIRKL